MPLKVQVGLSQKIGQPDYGSLGASCSVEYEADSSLLRQDAESFYRQVETAFGACRQAVQQELHRDPGDERRPPAILPADQGGPPDRLLHANGERRSDTRPATPNQVRAIQAIAQRLDLNLATWLHENFGLQFPAELSLAAASQAIDELKALAASVASSGPR